MSDLPADRVTPCDALFAFTAVDYFGTFYVKRAYSVEKRYRCIITCAATRAGHLEIAHSLDTDSFLNAPSRFICHKDQTQVNRSDNGTDLKACDKELRAALSAWNQHKIQSHLQQ